MKSVSAERKRDDDLPTGFTCECGARHKFSMYVYAHWRDELLHNCDRCGATHSVICGAVKPSNATLPKAPQ